MESTDRDLLALENLRLARWWAVRWATRLGLGAADLDDLEQEACLAILRAARAWQPERGPFAGYAGVCCKNACRRWLGNRGPAAEGLADDAGPDESGRLLDRLALREALGRLTPRQREVLTLRYGLAGEELTLRDAAARLGVSHWQVALEQRAALAELRARLN